VKRKSHANLRSLSVPLKTGFVEDSYDCDLGQIIKPGIVAINVVEKRSAKTIAFFPGP
jgi:hypothetical protein